VVKKVAEGYKVGDKTFKQHLDGYNFVPFFEGKEQQALGTRSFTSIKPGI
jgi:arylsulfatase